ncbi:hypothetical protein [Streptomyces sp. NPDC087300]|uniref:hypothetical protein n=1 Tax=Streptomyces sp. NPDC087300 TaxID=3365780 RepID=UPI003802798F
MHGHGYAPPPPPPPSGGSPATVRVLFVVLAVVTCGLLAWTTLLRLALVTRKAHDWALFGFATVLDVSALAMIGIDKGEDEFEGPGNVGMVVLLCTLVAVLAYYLYADIRHFSRYRAPRFDGYVPQQAQPAYGYPQQPAPGPVHQQPTQLHHQAPPQPPAHHTPQPPTRPAPARIHQVRAELDELSDYLRKQEGGS